MRILIAALLLLALGTVQAGDAEHGGVLAIGCMGCHGIPGYRNAYPSFRVPKLGGQEEEYLFLSLKGYQQSQRKHDTMHAQVADLEDQELRDLAAWFASLGEVQEASPGTLRGAAARGKERAQACASCHGQEGISPAPNWPTLAGQHRDYLEHTLRQYRDGQRTEPVMVGQSAQLTDQEIRDLAAYYAALPGLFTPRYTGRTAQR